MGQTRLGTVLIVFFYVHFRKKNWVKILIQGDHGPSHQTRTLGTHRTIHDIPSHNRCFAHNIVRGRNSTAWRNPCHWSLLLAPWFWARGRRYWQSSGWPWQRQWRFILIVASSKSYWRVQYTWKESKKERLSTARPILDHSIQKIVFNIYYNVLSCLFFDVVKLLHLKVLVLNNFLVLKY